MWAKQNTPKMKTHNIIFIMLWTRDCGLCWSMKSENKIPPFVPSIVFLGQKIKPLAHRRTELLQIWHKMEFCMLQRITHYASKFLHSFRRFTCVFHYSLFAGTHGVLYSSQVKFAVLYVCFSLSSTSIWPVLSQLWGLHPQGKGSEYSQLRNRWESGGVVQVCVAGGANCHSCYRSCHCGHRFGIPVGHLVDSKVFAVI